MSLKLNENIYNLFSYSCTDIVRKSFIHINAPRGRLAGWVIDKWIHTHTHTRTHARMHAHMHARMHAHTHTHTHTKLAINQHYVKS